MHLTIINLIMFYTYSFLATGPFGGSCQIHGPIPLQSESEDLSTAATPIDAEVGDASGIKSPIIRNPPKPPAFSHSYCPPEIHRSCFCVRFIAEHTKMQEDSTKVSLVLRIYINQFLLFCMIQACLTLNGRSHKFFQGLNRPILMTNIVDGSFLPLLLHNSYAGKKVYMYTRTPVLEKFST